MSRSFSVFIVIGITIGLLAGLSIAQDTNADVSKETSAGAVPDEEATRRVLYKGSQLWKAAIDDPEDRKLISELKNKGFISTWGGSRTSLDILVGPDHKEPVQAALRNRNISYDITIEDLQKEIDCENPPIPETEDRQGHRLTWVAYHRANDINGFLEYVSQTYPDLCTLSTIGTSHQGRPIKVLKISNGNITNKAVFIDGGIHAREWIAPASVTYIINHLISHFESEPSYVQNTDFYIAPLINPDGYEYTHTVDRVWRKNRRPAGSTTRCSGTDLNRNFGYKWGIAGVSKDPCDEIYGGSGAFSEPETRALKQFIQGNNPTKWKAYISFHSYGQYILYPWGYGRYLTPDHKDLEAVAQEAARAIQQEGGPRYTTGTAATTLYPASGGSDDWAKGTIGMKYSYTIELRDSGRYGFILPSRFIKDSGKDALAAIRVIVKAASKV